MKEPLITTIKRFAMLVLAAATLIVVLALPQARATARYVCVAGLIAAPLIGRAYIRAGDARGWALQNAALLVSAAALIAAGT